MGWFLPRKIGRLSVRLLALTVAFLMASEVLIFLPSVARFRMNYFANHIAAAHLAVQAIEATPDAQVSRPLADTLPAHVGAYGIVVHGPKKTLMIDAEMPPVVDDTCDLRTATVFEEI